MPCHLRVQNIGLKQGAFRTHSGTKVKTIERCSGHDGTWGIKTEFFKDSMKIGKPVFKAAEQFNPITFRLTVQLLQDILFKE